MFNRPTLPVLPATLAGGVAQRQAITLADPGLPPSALPHHPVS
jgi:hypothetical protein